MPHRAFSEKLNNLIHFGFSPPSIPDGLLDEIDLKNQLDGDKTSLLFMGQFTLDQTTETLEHFGILPQFRDQGYENLLVAFRPRDTFEHRLTIRNGDAKDPTGQDALLGEIIIKEGYLHPKVHYFPDNKMDTIDVIFIEWMLMQQPGKPFPPNRKRLPGQNWPGSGVGNKVIKVLYWLSRRLKKDGIINFPEFYHNGYFYSKWFFFYNPKKQAELLALYRDLTALGLDISDLSFALYFDCVVDDTKDAPFKWKAQEQIYPVSENVLSYFEKPGYYEAVKEAMPNFHFSFDRARFDRKIQERDTIKW